MPGGLGERHLRLIFFIVFIVINWTSEGGTNDNRKSRSLLITDQNFLTNEHEERLVIDIFKGYNNLIRPAPCRNSSVVFVEFGMALILLINVDEKNQIMQSNVWLTMQWNDCQFNWDPSEYGGLESMRVPVERVWVPDIVLFNNADGNYEVSYDSNVLISSNGNVHWVPPAIYKSSCRIDVEYFPFDEQTCTLLFGSWTYNADEVQLRWYNNKKSVELEDYSPSGIWDVMDVPGELVKNKSRVEFSIVIRRKTLFYTVILIIPTVLMAFLSMLVFYLPAECSEKITLAISILLALVVFLLLVSKILPPNSDTIPLMAKYLLLTFIMNIVTIMATVVIINIHFRSATTHTMPNCIRYIFLRLLPRLLMMRRPERMPVYNGFFVEDYDVDRIFDSSLIAPAHVRRKQFHNTAANNHSRNGAPRHVTKQQHMRRSQSAEVDQGLTSPLLLVPVQKAHRHECPKQRPPQLPSVSSGPNLKAPPPSNHHSSALAQLCRAGAEIFHTPNPEMAYEQRVSQEVRATVESIAYIAAHMKAEMSDKKVRDDWRYISMVIDRLMLLIFFGITLGGAIGMMFSATHVFEFVDQPSILRRLIAESKLQAEGVLGSKAEERLVIDLFKGYNNLIRPVTNVSSEPLEVAFSLAMVLLINVDEKNQIMQTNVWPTMRWVDYQMRWNPLEYENIRTIRVPPHKVWLPDIVLFNNADGNYEVSFYSNVVVEYTGEMLWVPPAIYKSSCIIDVEFFPFDEQYCSMIFGSWTYNKDEVTINYLKGKRQAEFEDYSFSGIWDILEAPGQLIQKKSKIAYRIRIRRKTLFYTVILIIPTVLMAFLSMLVFYLPAEADEKITLAISILLALVVFLLLVSKILPPTSDTIPLMAKYLLMTFVMNIITILVTVVIINIYFRGPTTHTMPNWVRIVFLHYLPLFLIMHRPRHDDDDLVPGSIRRKSGRQQRKSKRESPRSLAIVQNDVGAKKYPMSRYTPGEFIEMSKSKVQVHHMYSAELTEPNCTEVLRRRRMSQPIQTRPKFPSHRDLGSELSELLTDEALKAIDAIEYITEHLRRENQHKKIREEWKYVAMVIDRLLLYIFFAVTAGGTMGILFSAPNVFEYVDQTEVIKQLQRAAEAEITD